MLKMLDICFAFSWLNKYKIHLESLEIWWRLLSAIGPYILSIKIS